MSPAIHAHSAKQQSRSLIGARRPSTVLESPGVAALSHHQAQVTPKEKSTASGGICKTLERLLPFAVMGAAIGLFFAVFVGEQLKLYLVQFELQ